jgi:Transglutaminase-like superfamily
MAALSKILALTWREKWLLLKVVMLLFAARVALRFLPFQSARRLLVRVCRGSVETTAQAQEMERILQLTAAVGRRVPAIGTCLTQALTAYVLLDRRGYKTKLRIGVNKDRKGNFIAHAWLESDGRILLGELGTDLEGYTQFPALNGLEP